ncbi:small nuclear ribonucleoprotein E [Fistulifera solaris]|uniref:Small nuclear ribonucleoprotein E n=1 Tax=Fistulifera solaris TaxID=1519565 RepID=A0A1Z5JCU5_FISSO|nr:small nuclear ribonucleoprotein E [Fistulifera solaris]|eukprot:GAX11830.1 small nuclear ribonucleoprotein E [Fistulifera solaris]
MPPPKKVKKVMTLPINVIFSHLQKKTRVRIWLYEDTRMQIEGQIIGFDEYMNMVLDDAVELDAKKNNSRQEVGRILLKGDSITMLQEAQPVRPAAEEEG